MKKAGKKSAQAAPSVKKAALGPLHGYAKGHDPAKGYRNAEEVPRDDNPQFEDDRFNLGKVT
jgi:hypothetical protein